MNGYDYNTPLGQLAIAVNMLAGNLQSMANNPALPGPVQQDFVTMGRNLSASGDAAVFRMTADIMSGNGPVAQGMRATQRFFHKSIEKIDLSEMPVRQSLWTEVQMKDFNATEAYGKVFKFFNQYFSESEFEDGKKEVLINWDHNITFKLVLEYEQVQDTLGWIKKISYSYHPDPAFWTVMNTLERSTIMYNRHDFKRGLSVMHHVESCLIGFDGDLQILRLLADVFIPEIMLWMGRPPMKYGEENWTFCAPQDIDVSGYIRQLMVDKGIVEKEREIAFLDQLMNTVGYLWHPSNREKLDVPLKSLVGKLRLGTSQHGWHSYKKWEEDTFHKNRSPMFCLDHLSIFGVEMGSYRNLMPTQFVPAIKEGILTFIEEQVDRFHGVEKERAERAARMQSEE